MNRPGTGILDEHVKNTCFTPGIRSTGYSVNSFRDPQDTRKKQLFYYDGAESMAQPDVMIPTKAPKDSRRGRL